jgi:predicted nucleic acid-binding Zn ribbon protein
VVTDHRSPSAPKVTTRRALVSILRAWEGHVALRGTTDYRRTCPECSVAFKTIRADQKYCRASCRVAKHSRNAARARLALHMVIAWRRTRKKGTLTTLCFAIDSFLKEDHRRASRVGVSQSDSRKNGHEPQLDFGGDDV